MRNKTQLIARKRWKRICRMSERLVHDAVYCRPSLDGRESLAQRKSAKIRLYRGMIPVMGRMMPKNWMQPLYKRLMRETTHRLDLEFSQAMLNQVPGNLYGR